MLYDPKWEKNVKAEPSLIGLIAWLETQDPATEYQWSGLCTPCLIEQYVASIGLSKHDLYCVVDDRGHNLYDRLSLRNGGIAVETPHTFGAALERARAARSRPSPDHT